MFWLQGLFPGEAFLKVVEPQTGSSDSMAAHFCFPPSSGSTSSSRMMPVFEPIRCWWLMLHMAVHLRVLTAHLMCSWCRIGNLERYGQGEDSRSGIAIDCPYLRRLHNAKGNACLGSRRLIQRSAWLGLTGRLYVFRICEKSKVIHGVYSFLCVTDGGGYLYMPPTLMLHARPQPAKSLSVLQ